MSRNLLVLDCLLSIQGRICFICSVDSFDVVSCTIIHQGTVSVDFEMSNPWEGFCEWVRSQGGNLGNILNSLSM